ncbi:TetR/AcrR family transcriptional regulator [Nocardioides sp. SYSU DS0651]|uniref:TetR/AcrR family transcriptional regulator n=1 Tax=Nocardioides sp. SYSU DS0651 TaxID=3415955 RepID=UPI003F4C3E1F
MVLSAKGTRLNRRGLETRRQLLREALFCLAENGPEAASANAVVKRAGVTWGTIQHQFGDVDGLWAAVLEYVAEHRGPVFAEIPAQPGLGDRVEAVVEMLWAALEMPGSVAIYNLRDSLPRQREHLEASFPRTAQAIARWDAEWTAICERSFGGLDVDHDKLMRVRNLLPGAIRGVFNERNFSSYVDADEARRGLTEAITAYLRS